MSASDPAIAMTDDQHPSAPAAADDTPRDVAAKTGGTDWWGEAKAIFWLILGVLAFHSFVAKPFYIPSESMMPVLLKGDRLVVSKFPYGWSWVSPSFHVVPETKGRVLGNMPERGDIVILTPPGARTDYIKRVVGVPGDTIEMIAGQLYLNGKAVPREERAPTMIPVDANAPCDGDMRSYRVTGPDGALYCRLPVFRETLPNGVSYDTIDMGLTGVDDHPLVTVPEGHVFLMGDNRDKSADSRVPLHAQGLGGPVPWENVGGRAEFITFSLDGTSEYLNPLSWFSAMRSGRAGESLRPDEAPAQ
ncbi:MAG: signal peptidase I [Allosphingosinicella sp.]